MSKRKLSMKEQFMEKCPHCSELFITRTSYFDHKKSCRSKPTTQTVIISRISDVTSNEQSAVELPPIELAISMNHDGLAEENNSLNDHLPKENDSTVEQPVISPSTTSSVENNYSKPIIGQLNSTIMGNLGKEANFLLSNFLVKMESSNFSNVHMELVFGEFEKIIAFTLGKLLCMEDVQVYLKLAFYQLTSNYLRGKVLKEMAPVEPITVGKFNYLPVRQQLTWLFSRKPSLLAKFARENVVKNINQIRSEEDVTVLQSPLDGLRIARYLSKVPADIEYVCPVSIFYDEFTEVLKLFKMIILT